MLIGSMRVSTAEQSLGLQRDALERAGCERMFEHACSGETVVVWKLGRIARSLRHVVQLVSRLRDRGMGLEASTGEIDTASSTGRLVLGISVALADLERDLIDERPMAGLAAARARGRDGGRPRMTTKAKLKTAMTMMADQDDAAREAAGQLGASLSTPRTDVDENGQHRARATASLRPASTGSRPKAASASAGA